LATSRANHSDAARDRRSRRWRGSVGDALRDGGRPASHDYGTYVGMPETGGPLICVGLPAESITVHSLNIVFTRRCIAGSLIGGLPETQQMLGYCAEHQISSDVETIPIQQINETYQRMLKNDVKYRFVIAMSSLHQVRV
jgi:uncharacterized zinc-type alcohol dehydrogenase-like protein